MFNDRMKRFAIRVERTLIQNDALPSWRSDRSMIGDLAELEWRVELLRRGLKALVASPKSKVGQEEFETRIINLVGEIMAMHDVCRDLKGPLNRLIESRCGEGAGARALLNAAKNTFGDRAK